MANFNGSGRTNYFRVNDIEAYKQELKPAPVELKTSSSDSDLVCLLSNCETGSFSTYNEDDEEVCAIDITVRHLKDKEVAIFIESGSEKLRYISGHAQAVNNKGEYKNISLTDIYSLAKTLGSNVTTAEY